MAIKLPGTEKAVATETPSPAVADPVTPAASRAQTNSPAGVYFLVAFLLLVLPVAGFGIAYYFLGPMVAKAKEAAVQAELAARHNAGGAPAENGDYSESTDEGLLKPDPAVQALEKKSGKEAKTSGFELKDITVNVNGTRNTRFLRAAVVLQGSPAVLVELEDKKAQVTEIVQTALSSKTMDDLEGKDIRQRLREEIMMLVNSNMRKGAVTSIHFTDLVVQ